MNSPRRRMPQKQSAALSSSIFIQIFPKAAPNFLINSWSGALIFCCCGEPGRLLLKPDVHVLLMFIQIWWCFIDGVGYGLLVLMAWARSLSAETPKFEFIFNTPDNLIEYLIRRPSHSMQQQHIPYTATFKTLVLRQNEFMGEYFNILVHAVMPWNISAMNIYKLTLQGMQIY
jgi:hypothetical protein